jgi:hypothetical protein
VAETGAIGENHRASEIVINGKIHKNKSIWFYSSNKEGLIC